MNKKDILFLVLCIIFVLGIMFYVYQAEVYKSNAKKLCLENELRFCYCDNLNNSDVGSNDNLEKNNS